jgi:signal transduction histidine kinase
VNLMLAWLFTALILVLAWLVGLNLRLRARLAEHAANKDSGDKNASDLARLRRAEIIAEERQRIFGDLHDDIGAKLLDLVHTASTPEQADLARTALQDLRDVVSRSRGAPGSLLQVLGEMRSEAESRLMAGGVTLEWVQASDLPDPLLDQGHALHLYRIVREAISNALKHARPGQVRIRVSALGAADLLLDITDDGPEPFAPEAGTGQGTDSMRNRADALRGSIDWEKGTTGGTKVVLRVPLPDGAESPPPNGG